MKSLGMLVGALIVAAVIVVLWPAPDPLQGVETVAIGREPDVASEIISGLEFALGDHQIRIVSNPSEADAVITLVDVKSGDLNLSISEDGVRGSAHIVCEVEKNGERSLMDLYISFDNTEIKAELVGRKFYEVWK